MIMQTIYTYSYNPAIATGTNTTGTVWRMGYQQPIELYKGTSNQIKIVVFNSNQKVLNLSGYNIEVQIVDTANKTYHVTKLATIDNPINGVGLVTFTEADLANLDARFYDIVARLVDVPDYSTVLDTQILYLDDNFGAFTPVKILDAWNFGEGSPLTPNLDTNSISGNLIPSINNTYSIGNANLRWDHIYANIADIGNINISGDNIKSTGTTINLGTQWHWLSFTDVSIDNPESGTGAILKFDETNHGSGPTFETWYGNISTPYDSLGQHSLDIRAADANSYVELASYDWNNYVTVNNAGVQIFTNWIADHENYWTFGANGWLALPNNGKMISSSGKTSIQMGYDDIRLSTRDIDGSTIHTTLFDTNGDVYISKNLLPGYLDTGPTPINSIGTTEHPWKDLYLSGGTIYLNNIPLGLDNSNNLTFNSKKITTFETNGSLNATGNIIPTANVTYSLGNVNYQWKDLWVSNNTIYLNSIPLSIDSGGNLTVNGNVVTGGANTGNLAFINNSMYNIGGVNIENSDLSHGVTAALTLPSNGNISNPVHLINTYGNVNLTAGANPGALKNWIFSSNGNLTLPGSNASISNNGEFRIWSTDTDITVYRNGQDGYGVKANEISVYANNIKITKTSTSGLELLTGTLSFPDNSTQSTAYRYNAQTSPPTLTQGALWFNSDEGRLYINYNNAWVDASPTEIDPSAIRFNEQNQIELPVGGDISYAPGNISDWQSPAPTGLVEAVDRLAALLKVLNSGVGA